MSEEFYDEYVGKVYKFFYYKILNKQVAEDLTQDTWIRFIEKQTNTIEDSKKYLYGIMRNCWLEFLRDKYSSIAENIEEIDDFEGYVNTINAQNSSDELPARIQKYVDLLPDRQRAVFDLRFIHGMNVKDTAIELGKDKNYVKTTYKRALATLRAVIEEPYLYIDAAEPRKEKA